MIAVIFEVWPKPEYRQHYFDLAADLRPILETIDGFISVERFESLTEKGKVLSVSFWRDEAAVAQGGGTPQVANQRTRDFLCRLPAADRQRDPRLRHARPGASTEG
jgi:heme-degrading monooxygenase HmoA